MTIYKLKILLKAYRTIGKLVVTRITGGGRTDANVKAEYGHLWDQSGKDEKKYIGIPQPYYKYNRLALLRRIDRKKSLIEHLNDTIASLQPKTILELGSGAGMNVLCLALLNPHISFTGLEYTAEGIETSKKLIANPPLRILSFTLGMSEEEILSRLPKIQLTFIQGDMRAQPFKDGSFDFVFTYLAVEQIARNCNECFREVYRVIKPKSMGHALFVESFKEAQKTYTQRLVLWASDYFRYSIRVVEKENLRVVRYQEMDFQNLQLGLGSLLVDHP
jgi:ubiquinone/menaquinone biosynthesis C-methylase UbiE